MLKNRIVLVASLAGSMVLMGIQVFAQAPVGNPKSGVRPVSRPPYQSVFLVSPSNAAMPISPNGIREAIRSLKLPEDQQTKALAVFESSQMKIQELISKNQPNRDMIEALKAVPFDRSKLDASAAAALKLEQTVTEERVNMWASLFQILTPDQQKQFWNSIFNPTRDARPAQAPPPAPNFKPEPKK